MYMVHHYLQRGVPPEKVINLPHAEKLFYRASMELYFEEEAEKYRALGGGS